MAIFISGGVGTHTVTTTGQNSKTGSTTTTTPSSTPSSSKPSPSSASSSSSGSSSSSRETTGSYIVTKADGTVVERYRDGTPDRTISTGDSPSSTPSQTPAGSVDTSAYEDKYGYHPRTTQEMNEARLMSQEGDSSVSASPNALSTQRTPLSQAQVEQYQGVASQSSEGYAPLEQDDEGNYYYPRGSEMEEEQESEAELLAQGYTMTSKQGVYRSPKADELVTVSIISDVIAEGWAEYRPTQYGFELKLTESGKAMKEVFLPALTKNLPDTWELTGSTDTLKYQGKPEMVVWNPPTLKKEWNAGESMNLASPLVQYQESGTSTPKITAFYEGANPVMAIASPDVEVKMLGPNTAYGSGLLISAPNIGAYTRGETPQPTAPSEAGMLERKYNEAYSFLTQGGMDNPVNYYSWTGERAYEEMKMLSASANLPFFDSKTGTVKRTSPSNLEGVAVEMVGGFIGRGFQTLYETPKYAVQGISIGYGIGATAYEDYAKYGSSGGIGLSGWTNAPFVTKNVVEGFKRPVTTAVPMIALGVAGYGMMVGSNIMRGDVVAVARQTAIPSSEFAGSIVVPTAFYGGIAGAVSNIPTKYRAFTKTVEGIEYGMTVNPEEAYGTAVALKVPKAYTVEWYERYTASGELKPEMLETVNVGAGNVKPITYDTRISQMMQGRFSEFQSGTTYPMILQDEWGTPAWKGYFKSGETAVVYQGKPEMGDAFKFMSPKYEVTSGGNLGLTPEYQFTQSGFPNLNAQTPYAPSLGYEPLPFYQKPAGWVMENQANYMSALQGDKAFDSYQFFSKTVGSKGEVVGGYTNIFSKKMSEGNLLYIGQTLSESGKTTQIVGNLAQFTIPYKETKYLPPLAESGIMSFKGAGGRTFVDIDVATGTTIQTMVGESATKTKVPLAFPMPPSEASLMEGIGGIGTEISNGAGIMKMVAGTTTTTQLIPKPTYDVKMYDGAKEYVESGPKITPISGQKFKLESGLIYEPKPLSQTKITPITLSFMEDRTFQPISNKQIFMEKPKQIEREKIIPVNRLVEETMQEQRQEQRQKIVPIEITGELLIEVPPVIPDYTQPPPPPPVVEEFKFKVPPFNLGMSGGPKRTSTDYSRKMKNVYKPSYVGSGLAPTFPMVTIGKAPKVLMGGEIRGVVVKKKKKHKKMWWEK